MLDAVVMSGDVVCCSDPMYSNFILLDNQNQYSSISHHTKTFMALYYY